MFQHDGGSSSVLRALASPVRQEILDRLALGSATSAGLARQLGSNTGVLSYHLRQLAKAGLIERDDDRSGGRELFWRIALDDIRHDEPALADDPRAARTAVDVELARAVRSIRDYTTRTDLGTSWREAALFSRSNLRLTPPQLEQMNGEYLAFVTRWSARSDDASAHAEHVRVRYFAYPDPAPVRTEPTDHAEGGRTR